MKGKKIVRCTGCGVEMTNPNYGQHTGEWLYYCPNCRKYRDKNEEKNEEENE